MVLAISQQAIDSLAASHAQRLLPHICSLLAQAISSDAGAALGLPPELANDQARITRIIGEGVEQGIDGDNDLVSYGLLNIHPNPRLPVDTAEWIAAVIADQDNCWIDKLDAIYRLLPEPLADLLFPPH